MVTRASGIRMSLIILYGSFEERMEKNMRLEYIASGSQAGRLQCEYRVGHKCRRTSRRRSDRGGCLNLHEGGV